MKISVEVSGGLELICGNVKDHELDIPEDSLVMSDLLLRVKRDIVKERPELFLQHNTVRPGILVLINEIDWELEDTINYILKDKDHILFISTLHGG